MKYPFGEMRRNEMHEAVHVAALLAAGIDLVHRVQMRDALAHRGEL